MIKRKKERRRPSRLDRIERKVDRVLAEVLTLKHRAVASDRAVDNVLDRMHGLARRMRMQCEKEYEHACRIVSPPL